MLHAERMRMVCFGQQNWDYCWTAKQQLLTRLAARGHRVLYVDPQPVERASSPREAMRAIAPLATESGVREVRPGLFVYTFVHAPGLGYRANEWRRPRVLRAWLRRLGFDDAVAVVLHPLHAPVVESLTPRGLVYFAVDDVAAFPNMSPGERERIRSLEYRMLSRADAAVGVSSRLCDRFRLLCRRTELLPNAADVEHFGPAALARVQPHPALGGLPHPRVGCIGQIDERIDQALLVQAARARPRWTWVLAGRVKRGVDVSRLLAEPNIHLTGYAEYRQLPSIVRELDAGIVPYVGNDVTHACNPLKAFEYLAAGRPVVSTPLEGLGPLTQVVAVAATPEGFVAALEQALGRADATRASHLAFAAEHGWDARVNALERLLEDVDRAHARRPRPAVLPLDPGYAGTHPSPVARVLLAASRSVGALRRRLSGGRLPAVPRILVSRRCRLGDLVVFLPALRALRRAFPDSRIVLAMQAGSAHVPLRELLPVDEVREAERPGRSSLRRLADAVRLMRERFHLVLSGAGYFVLRDPLLAGAPVRVGLDDGHPWQRYNTGTIELDPGLHEAENNLRIVEALGVEVKPDDRVPRIDSVPDAAANEGQRLLAAEGLGPGQPYVVVHLGAQKPSRRWPPDRYAALLARLDASHPELHVLCTGVSSERALVHAMRDALPLEARGRVHDCTGATAVLTMVALMQQARAVICNDTGAMHLARAAGAPLLALLGPENHRRWGPHPWGTAPAVAVRHEVPCAPCQRWECAAHFCLRMLAVDEAEAALQRILAGGAAGSKLQPLELRLQRHDWRGVAAAGLPLPLVTVMLLARRRDGTREGDGASRVHASLDAIAEQSYPNIEVVLAHTASAPPVNGRFAGLRSVRVSAAARAAWREALSAVRGEFVAPTAPGFRWTAGKLADDVAMLIRRPDLGAVFCAFEQRRRSDRPSVGSATFRRSAVNAGGRPALQLGARLASLPPRASEAGA